MSALIKQLLTGTLSPTSTRFITQAAAFLSHLDFHCHPVSRVFNDVYIYYSFSILKQL